MGKCFIELSLQDLICDVMSAALYRQTMERITKRIIIISITQADLWMSHPSPELKIYLKAIPSSVDNLKSKYSVCSDIN